MPNGSKWGPGSAGIRNVQFGWRGRRAAEEQDPEAVAEDVVSPSRAVGDVAQEDADGVVPGGVAEDLGVDLLTALTYMEPPAGIEPATPSLPSMRGGFTTPCSTSCLYTTAQVSSAAKGWVVGRREAARSTVSGKSLARACTAVHDMDAGAIVRSPADSRLAPQVQCCPRQLRVERRANGEVHPLWQTGTRQPVGCSMSACLGRKTGRALVR